MYFLAIFVKIANITQSNIYNIMKQYIKPKTTTERETIAQSLLCGSSVSTISDRDFGTCPICGKRGGNHKGWCGYHKRHY